MLCKDFSYKGLIKFFEELSAIPRPSGHEKAIADYLCNFATERGLEYYRDAVNNVLIKIGGSGGRENEPAILLQGHTDMVCEKNDGVEHDFLNDSLSLYEQDGWIRARGTTLGADNGVAVAVMLYILDGAEGNISSHPPIECLFTTSEEVGMTGAYMFDYSKISARKMINMDSADESLIIAGCTGGQRATLIFEPKTERSYRDCVEITVKGLAGGHSGEDIHRGRANANKLLGRILLSLSQKMDIRLVSFDGGSKDNAIPREATAKVTVKDVNSFISEARDLEGLIAAELSSDDNGFELFVHSSDLAEESLTNEDTEKAIYLLATVQNGVFEMNHDMNDLVEFSRNIGVVRTLNDGKRVLKFTFSARSPKPSQLAMSSEQLKAYADLLGMELEYGVSYPGWIYSKSSRIRDIYANAYNELYGAEPSVTTIHAGLECGVIKEKIPDMDIISCGPVVLNLHSPDEALNIASFERFFAVIIKVLEK